MKRSAMHAWIALPRGDSSVLPAVLRVHYAALHAPYRYSATPEQVIAGQWKVNNIVAGTNFPKVPDEMIHNIIYENWKRALPEYA